MKGQIYRLGAIATVLLTVLSLGAPAVRAAATGAWYAEYYANRDLTGGPAVTRHEDRLHFEWGNGSPDRGVPADNFSARWTRDEGFESGTYRFSYRSDDGIRIWVGDTLVVDDWRDREAAWSIVDRFIPRGTHRVRVEYYEHSGGAALQVGWERVSSRAGWRGEYFGNRDLTGSPVLVRYDPAIDFDWKDGSPDPAVPADDFSVRWTRTVELAAGTYRFYTSSDDGVRIYVNDGRVVDAWGGAHQSNTRWGDVTLGGGQHTVAVKYYERSGRASAHVWWDRLGAFGGWEGRYYDNAELRGGPVLIRDDAADRETGGINFDWGEGAPTAGMPNDNFSVAWTRQVNFDPGYYRFNVRSDDGVRVWLDKGLLMDYWRPMDYEWHYADGTYLEGTHTVKVEYYEHGGGARVRFWWESSSTAPSPTGPAPAPAPASAPSITSPGPWQGEYFNNQGLTGAPVLVRTDAALDFNWGWEAPAAGMNRDEFSVRWRGTFPFEAGRYRFTTTTDDGVRLTVDDQAIVDAWRPMRGTHAGYASLSQGNHAVRVEYFDRNQAAMARVAWQRVGAAAISPTPAPRPASTTCAGGPLRLDAWPVGRDCGGGGWTATVFVEGHGGDCQYTYAWERQVQGGPTPNSMTFELKSASRGTAIVGKASVTSAGQTVTVGLHIPPPPGCR
jgi:hypothetical protein